MSFLRCCDSATTFYTLNKKICVQLMREYSRLILCVIMDLKFKFNAKEYATLNGITASALRKRRLSGKLEGQYIKKGSEYFYSTGEGIRPNKEEFTPNNSRKRRRNVHDSRTNYHRVRNGHQFKLHNDMKQLARIKGRLKEEEIEEITEDIFEVAKQRRKERLAQATQRYEATNVTKNYGGFINCNNRGFKDVQTSWRELNPKPKDEYDRYLEDDTNLKEPGYY